MNIIEAFKLIFSLLLNLIAIRIIEVSQINSSAILEEGKGEMNYTRSNIAKHFRLMQSKTISYQISSLARRP